jgi:hypothetical protein
MGDRACAIVLLALKLDGALDGVRNASYRAHDGHSLDSAGHEEKCRSARDQPAPRHPRLHPGTDPSHDHVTGSPPVDGWQAGRSLLAWLGMPGVDLASASAHANQSARSGFAVISYKREQVDHARRIMLRLKREQLDVWWAEDLQCGAEWNQELDEKFATASCIIVLWSPESMQSRWVMHEASTALIRQVYAPVRIELCEIESPFDRHQATDVLNWDGQSPHPGIEALLTRVRSLLPLPQSTSERVTTWLRQQRASVLLGLIAVVALGLLSWQTLAGLRLRDDMSQQLTAIRQQAEVLREQSAAMTAQAKHAARQAKRFEQVAERQQSTARRQRRELKNIRESAARQIASLGGVSREVKYSALQNVPLTSLEVRWTLLGPASRSVFPLVARAQCDYLAFSDDDTKWWPAAVFSKVCDSLQTTHAVMPAVRAVASGIDDSHMLYPNGLDALLSAKPEGIDGFAEHVVYYEGPRFELLFPLASDSSVVISLGDLNDAPQLTADPEREGDKVQEYVDAHTRHGFETSVSAGEDGLGLSWEYSSLDDALDGRGATGFFPTQFKFAIVHGELPRDQYAQHLKEIRRTAPPVDAKVVKRWSQQTRLEVVVNGMTDFAYTYSVANLGRGSVAVVPDPAAAQDTDESILRPQLKAYDFTLFEAIRQGASR